MNYYMTNVKLYAFYACCLWGLGLLIQKVWIIENVLQISLKPVEKVAILTENENVDTVEAVVET